ncbi:MAG: hypothetical protein P8046_05210, partial [Anaerolineales bacterium]
HCLAAGDVPLCVADRRHRAAVWRWICLLLGGDAIQSGDPAMMWPIILGVFLLVIVVGVPLAFLTGLRETFKSTSWTLTYREIKSLSALENGDAPLLEVPPTA